MVSYEEIYAWPNLLKAWQKAAKGKRGGGSAAAFEYKLTDNLIVLQKELLEGTYQPGSYTHFYIKEPKLRKISAAPFRDRVVHHALCNVIEPTFEKLFIPDSYANRVGKGTHKAVDRLQHFCKKKRYVLRLDIVKHFPSIDHAILLNNLSEQIYDSKICHLIKTIIDSGQGIFKDEYDHYLFPEDDLISLCRPKGLPIGNLTSKFWSNCYLHPLDCFIKRELSCKCYLRYVDDFALFSDSKEELWEWKLAIKDKLAELRLRFHEHSAQVIPVNHGVPWLGVVIYPNHSKIKARKVVHASRRLKSQYKAYQNNEIGFLAFDACVQGWINHVRYADSWGLRRHVLKKFKR